MTSEELSNLLSGDPKALVEKIKSTNDLTPIEGYLKELDPETHQIFDANKRKNKVVKDNEGNDTTVYVTRIAIALQKLIVSRAASFLCGNPIILDGIPQGLPEENLRNAVYKTWLDNKLDFKSKRLAKLMMSETACAELWYVQETDKEYWAGTNVSATSKLRVKILAQSLGDNLYPVFDDFGDMIAFGRGYKTKNAAGKEVENFDLYTADKTVLSTNDGGWLSDTQPNPSGKIPVIYYSQPQPEWADVQTMIERLETVISNNADTNDYFGSPMVVVDGEIVGFAQKGETGKVLETKNGAKVSYLTWDQAPEAVKNEIDNLLRFIYTLTDTPDISFEQMKSIGGNAPSGFALKMLFLGAHLKASEKEEIFGEGVQRRINYLKAALAKIAPPLAKGMTVNLSPKFEYYLPKNDAEKIDILNSAVSGGILSTETAIVQNPLIEDADAEKERIKGKELQNELDQ
jgi:SPP1 family phage portal protein